MLAWSQEMVDVPLGHAFCPEIKVETQEGHLGFWHDPSDGRVAFASALGYWLDGLSGF